jgi:hypothetical protein
MSAAGLSPPRAARHGRCIRALPRDCRPSSLRKAGLRDPLTSLDTVLAAGAAATRYATVEEPMRESYAALTRAERASGGRCVAPPQPSRRCGATPRDPGSVIQVMLQLWSGCNGR